MSHIIIIRGPLGSGKTTVAKKLSSLLRGKYFSVDKILDEYDLGHDKEDGYISQKSFLKTNEILTPNAKKFLDKNVPIVFDGNFYWRSHIKDLASRLNVKSYIFTLKAPLDVCIKRDKARIKSYGADEVKAVYKKSRSLDCGIEIDSSESEDQVIQEILIHLNKI